MRSILVTSNSCIPLIDGNELFEEHDILIAPQVLSTIPKKFNGTVYALGGGTVIDMAKIMAGNKPCFACPTNASGAARTSHAVVWNGKKTNVQTTKPILLQDYKYMEISLSPLTLARTMTDCRCHILESRFSTKATAKSLKFCELAEFQFGRYIANGNILNLIEAGNLAGDAIEITGTNFIHAISYVLTLEHGLCHGEALREALQIRTHSDWKEIIEKAKKYPKFFESTLL